MSDLKCQCFRYVGGGKKQKTMHGNMLATCWPNVGRMIMDGKPSGGNFPCKVDLALFCIQLLATIFLRYCALLSKKERKKESQYSHNNHHKSQLP